MITHYTAARSKRESLGIDMARKNYHLIQQAERDLFLGKPGLALEQYQKIYELDPEDTTVISTIADLSMQMADCGKALLWYRKLVNLYERRGMPANATAVYRKILKISPNDQDAMHRLAELYEQQGQLANAKLQYKLCAHVAAYCATPLSRSLYLYKKICTLDPHCHESQLKLAQLLEQAGQQDEALEAYLRCANLHAERNNIAAAGSIVEKIIQMNPRRPEFLKDLFPLLGTIDMAEAGIRYMLSHDQTPDPQHKIKIAILLDPANRPVLTKYLPRILRQTEGAYPAATSLLEECLARQDWPFSLDLADAMLESALQLCQTDSLKRFICYICNSEPGSIRALSSLATLLIRTGDVHELEMSLKKLAILHLRQGNFNEAREAMHKLVAHCHNCTYLELINWLDDYQSHEQSQIRQTIARLIQALEQGSWETRSLFSDPVEGGASALDLGLGLQGDETPAHILASVTEGTAQHLLPLT